MSAEDDRPYSLLLDSAYPEQIALELAREHRFYLNEALRLVAAGESPSEEGLAEGIRSATLRYRGARPYLADAELDPVFADADQKTLTRLRGVVGIAERKAAKEEERSRSLKALRKPFGLKARATIQGTLDVTKSVEPDGVRLSWSPGQPVFGWTVRIASKDKRSRDYAVVEELALAADERQYLLPLDEGALYRLHILGRNRSGKVIERSLISSLSAENQRDKWERRATSV